MNKRQILYRIMVFVLAMSLSCTPQSPASTPTVQPTSAITAAASLTPPSEASQESTSVPTVTEVIPVTGHLMEPAEFAPVSGSLIYDVTSSGNAAPYGDIYKLNRLERPFLQDMTYVSDMDIATFNLSEDADWFYVSMELRGSDPNNAIGINYGVEIDLDFDGFGDFILWAHPPYSSAWDTSTVQIFKDTDHDSAGELSQQSDASTNGNGYDTQVFDGGTGQAADPDLAWVRINADPKSTVQFAFKKSLTGSFFMLGVVADAGLRDISKFDYNDHFKEDEAGSPEQNTAYYPLGSLYAVDSTCWEAYGIEATGYEPKSCQPILQPTPIFQLSGNETAACVPDFVPSEYCETIDGVVQYDPSTCNCTY